MDTPATRDSVCLLRFGTGVWLLLAGTAVYNGRACWDRRSKSVLGWGRPFILEMGRDDERPPHQYWIEGCNQDVAKALLSTQAGRLKRYYGKLIIKLSIKSSVSGISTR